MEDAQDVLSWRNDTVTRRMSGTIDLITEGSHFEWFEKVIENPKVLMLIGFDEHTNAKIGMVRFDLNDNFSRAEISININPEYRSKGYSSRCLIHAAEFLSLAYPACGVIDALVKEENLASVRVFSSVGYREITRRDGLINFQIDIK